MSTQQTNKKITKLSDLNQVDGKLHKDSPTTLDQILGAGFHKYNNINEENYSSLISNMNVAELRSHSIKIGIIPNSNRDRLIKQLLGEFKKYNSTFKKPGFTDANVKLNSTKAGQKKLDTAMNIMRGVK